MLFGQPQPGEQSGDGGVRLDLRKLMLLLFLRRIREELDIHLVTVPMSLYLEFRREISGSRRVLQLLVLR